MQIAAYNDKGVDVFSDSYTIKTKEGVPEARRRTVSAARLLTPLPYKYGGRHRILKK